MKTSPRAPTATPPVRALRFSPLFLVLLTSALLWGVLFSAFPPVDQEFPFNDDWAFAWGAIRFARGEGIHYLQWASMPLLGQWLWAYPFLQLFGESCVAVRISTIVLSWLGLAAFYDLLRQASVSERLAALATAALALNPLFFFLSGTFMTDVPALAFSLIALALYGRALKGGKLTWLAAGTAVALFAAVTRQNTITVPAAVGILLLRDPRYRRHPLWWLAVLLPLGAGLAGHFWMKSRKDVLPFPPEYPTLQLLLFLPYVALHLAGLAALPLLVLQPLSKSWKRFLLFFGGVFLVGVYWGYNIPRDNDKALGNIFPYLPNTLTVYGAFLGGGELVLGERPRLLSFYPRLILTLLGCLGAAGLLVCLADLVRCGFRCALLLVFTVLHIPFLLITEIVFDRYLLVLFPGALALAATTALVVRVQLGAAWAVLALYGFLSVAIMHDWLAWNSARFALGRRAVEERHIPAADIEGGFEWDGWYAVHARPVNARPPRGLVLPFNQCLFPDLTGRYGLAFQPLPHTVTVDREPYRLWLHTGTRYFYLVKQAKPDEKSREKPASPDNEKRSNP